MSEQEKITPCSTLGCDNIVVGNLGGYCEFCNRPRCESCSTTEVHTVQVCDDCQLDIKKFFYQLRKLRKETNVQNPTFSQVKLRVYEMFAYEIPKCSAIEWPGLKLAYDRVAALFQEEK